MCAFCLVSLGIISVTAIRAVGRARAAAAGGVQHIESALTAVGIGDIPTAEKNFLTAKNDLTVATDQMRFAISGVDWLLPRIPVIGRKVGAARALVRAASAAASAGYEAVAAVPSGTKPAGLTIEKNGLMKGSLGWLATLSDDPARLERVLQTLVGSYSDIMTVKPDDVPSSARAQFESWQRVGAGLFGSPARLESLTNMLLAIAGQSVEQDYLIVFQNNDELRPTGGFMGSYVLMKFHRGTFAVTDAPGTGPYALKELIQQNIRPPVPLDTVTPALSMVDANWDPDARRAGVTISELYRQARGFTPDGVIFITPEIVERLLQIVGPITVEGASAPISSDTFVAVAEQESEINFDKAVNAPKLLLIRLLPSLFEKLSRVSLADGLKAVATAFDEAEKGNVIITSTNAAVAKASTELRWDGAMRFPTKNFFAEVDANVNSGKTDRTMHIQTDLVVAPGEDVWKYTATMTRKQAPSSGSPLHDYPSAMYTRFIIPAEATVTQIDSRSMPPDTFFIDAPKSTVALSLPGLEKGLVLADADRRTAITKYAAYQEVGFWSYTEPGQTTTAVVSYTLPTSSSVTDEQLELYWKRQPGALNRGWSLTVAETKKAWIAEIPSTGWHRSKENITWNGVGDSSRTLILQQK